MQRIVEEELEELRRGILSQDHLINTARHYQIEPTDVTAQQLILHWDRHHPIRMKVVRFQVQGELFEPEIPITAFGNPA